MYIELQRVTVKFSRLSCLLFTVLMSAPQSVFAISGNAHVRPEVREFCEHRLPAYARYTWEMQFKDSTKYQDLLRLDTEYNNALAALSYARGSVGIATTKIKEVLASHGCSMPIGQTASNPYGLSNLIVGSNDVTPKKYAKFLTEVLSDLRFNSLGNLRGDLEHRSSAEDKYIIIESIARGAKTDGQVKRWLFADVPPHCAVAEETADGLCNGLITPESLFASKEAHSVSIARDTEKMDSALACGIQGAERVEQSEALAKSQERFSSEIFPGVVRNLQKTLKTCDRRPWNNPDLTRSRSRDCDAISAAIELAGMTERVLLTATRPHLEVNKVDRELFQELPMCDATHFDCRLLINKVLRDRGLGDLDSFCQEGIQYSFCQEKEIGEITDLIRKNFESSTIANGLNKSLGKLQIGRDEALDRTELDVGQLPVTVLSRSNFSSNLKHLFLLELSGQLPSRFNGSAIDPRLSSSGMGSEYVYSGMNVNTVGTGMRIGTSAGTLTWLPITNLVTKRKYTVDAPLPVNEDGVPVPSSEYPHSQIGSKEGRNGKYRQTREWGDNGEVKKTTDWTDHGRGHPNPHDHECIPNPAGGTPKRGPAKPQSK